MAGEPTSASDQLGSLSSGPSSPFDDIQRPLARPPPASVPIKPRAHLLCRRSGSDVLHHPVLQCRRHHLALRRRRYKRTRWGSLPKLLLFPISVQLLSSLRSTRRIHFSLASFCFASHRPFDLISVCCGLSRGGLETTAYWVLIRRLGIWLWNLQLFLVNLLSCYSWFGIWVSVGKCRLLQYLAISG